MPRRVRHTAHLALAAFITFAALVSCKQDVPPPTTPPSPATSSAGLDPAEPAEAAKPAFDPALLDAFGPLPEDYRVGDAPPADALVVLGRMLYHDARLSKNHDVSCNTCHDLTRYGVDGLPTSKGHRGQRGDRNSPTVFNAAGHVAQFWDGRAADVEAQAKGPVLNPIEMAMPNADFVIATLRSIPGYAKAFAEAFPGEAAPITFDNFARAVGAFERKLVTPSRFDRAVAGELDALTAPEKAGLTAFVQAGCTTCHNGPQLGGHIFQKLGLVKAWPDQTDTGRHRATGKDADRQIFKVPSLRNIAKTGPYFHDGKVATVDKAVRLMAKHQLGRTLDDAQVASIATFLGALTGELPANLIAPPDLPPSGPQTPKPDPT